MSLDFATIQLPTKQAEAQQEAHARELLEKLRWPKGPICPHCGSVEAYRITPKKSGSETRQGLLKCKACRKQFTVTVGTIFEDSHIPLRKWLHAIHLLCASKKGMSAHQLHRMLDVTYKSAWFMAHRIRYAMTRPPLSTKLKGTVEADETYIGGFEKGKPGRPPDSRKAPVVALVERGGRVRSFPIEWVTSKNLREITRKHVAKSARMMTDEATPYRYLKEDHASHQRVMHSIGEYVRGRHGEIHTNTVEGYFAILKRGINGVYHHVSRKHLHRYLDEFDFRYSARHITDGDRATMAAQGFEGKQLMYRDSSKRTVI